MYNSRLILLLFILLCFLQNCMFAGTYLAPAGAIDGFLFEAAFERTKIDPWAPIDEEEQIRSLSSATGINESVCFTFYGMIKEYFNYCDKIWDLLHIEDRTIEEESELKGYDKKGRFEDKAREDIQKFLDDHGIKWKSIRYHGFAGNELCLKNKSEVTLINTDFHRLLNRHSNTLIFTLSNAAFHSLSIYLPS